MLKKALSSLTVLSSSLFENLAVNAIEPETTVPCSSFSMFWIYQVGEDENKRDVLYASPEEADTLKRIFSLIRGKEAGLTNTSSKLPL